MLRFQTMISAIVVVPICDFTCFYTTNLWNSTQKRRKLESTVYFYCK